MPPCLTLSIIRYGSRVNGDILGKEYRPSQHLGVVAIEKGTFGSPSTMVANNFNPVSAAVSKTLIESLYFTFIGSGQLSRALSAHKLRSWEWFYILTSGAAGVVPYIVWLNVRHVCSCSVSVFSWQCYRKGMSRILLSQRPNCVYANWLLREKKAWNRKFWYIHVFSGTACGALVEDELVG